MKLVAELLGPVSLRVDGTPVALAGERQRACLALLLLAGGRPVDSATLREELWGEQPLARADASLQMQMSRLRRALRDAGLAPERLVAENGGYALRLETCDTDVDRFELLLAQAREDIAAGELDAARSRLREALHLHRGTPLHGAGDGPEISALRGRFEALRTDAAIELADAELRSGRHAAAIPGLQALCEENPFEERSRGLLMLALYRSGRQAEALAVYRSLRATLSGELGLEPTPALRALHDAILHQDPDLDLQTAAARPSARQAPDSPAPARRASARQGVWRAVAVAGCAITFAAAALLITGRLTRAGGLSFVASDRIAEIDPRTQGVLGAISGVADPVALVAGGQVAWIADGSSSTVVRLDPRGTGTALSVGVDPPRALALGAGGVWVLSEDARTVQEVNPQAARVVRTIPVGNGPVAIATGAGAVWVADAFDGVILRIDPTSGRILARVAVGGTPQALAAGAGAVWVADGASGVLDEIDPTTNLVTATVTTGSHPDAIAIAAGDVWVADARDGTVTRIDPASGSVIGTVRVGAGGNVLASGAGGLWVDGPRAGELSRIDPNAGTLGGRVGLGSPAVALAFAGDRLLAATAQAPDSRRGGVLRVVGLRGPPVLAMADPDATFDQDAWQMQAMTNDGLVAAHKVDGALGAQIVPDLASELPVASDGGRTWTFRLRSGVRYSTGRPVRASDVRASFERLERVGSQTSIVPALPPLGLVGETACRIAPRSCDLSRGVIADDRAGTVVLHLTAPQPRLLEQLATPPYSILPADTPDRPLTRPAVPATGPYEVIRQTPGEVDLARNPWFVSWSAAAQPPGLPDRVVWQLRTDPATGLREVLAGQADVLDASAGPSQADLLATRYPTQLHLDPVLVTEAIFLVTNRGVFADPRVRQAAALVTDRRRLAADEGPSLVYPVTCQILPPGLPGFRPFCPYTAGAGTAGPGSARANSAGAGTAGAWSAPALDRARALVRQAGVIGRSVTLAAPSDRPAQLRVVRDFAAGLRQIGLQTRIVTRPAGAGATDSYFPFIGDPRSGAQGGWTHWLIDAPDPSQFFLGVFTCDGVGPGSEMSGNVAQYCSRQTDSAIARAQAASGQDPASGTEAWADVDHLVTESAAWIPFANMRSLDVVSRRAAGWAFNPIYSILLDQISVR